MTEQNGKKQERNLEEEAHQLGLSSWDRVDKWLKRKKKIITFGNPRSESKDLENLFMDKERKELANERRAKRGRLYNRV